MRPPRHSADRFRGHALPAEALVYARPPGSRWVYVGLEGRGYVRLRRAEALGVAYDLARLAGARPVLVDPDEADPRAPG